MLQRLALAAAFNQFTHGAEFRRQQCALEVQIQLHARQLEQVGQQQFRLQPGRINPLFGQELRAALNGFKNRHTENGTCKGRRSKPKRGVGVRETAVFPSPTTWRAPRPSARQRICVPR